MDYLIEVYTSAVSNKRVLFWKSYLADCFFTDVAFLMKLTFSLYLIERDEKLNITVFSITNVS